MVVQGSNQTSAGAAATTNLDRLSSRHLDCIVVAALCVFMYPQLWLLG